MNQQRNASNASAVIRIIVWSLVALLLIGLLLGGFRHDYSGLTRGIFFSGFPGFSGRFSSNFDSDSTYTRGGGSVPSADIAGIHIEWVDGSVNVLPGDGTEISFSETSRTQLSEDLQMYFTVRNGILEIEYCAPGVNVFPHIARGKELTVTVPRDLYLEVFEVEAVSASVTVDGVQAYSADMEIVSGSLDVQNVKVDDVLDVEAVSGRIRMNAVTAEHLSIEGASGSISLEDCTLRDVNCSVISGSILIEPGADVEHINADSVSGSLRVRLPENDGFTASFDGGTGSFRCDFPATMQGKRTAVYNDGGADFDFSTLSGSIRIEKK